MNPTGRTVRVLLHAGLGNQMFMYAAGRALAARIGARLVLDVSRFPRDTVYRRTYGLDRFPIHAAVDQGSSLLGLLPLRLTNKAERVIRGSPALRRLCGVIDETQPAGPTIFAPPANRTLYLDGYWQSERYFADHADLIAREVMPPRPDDDTSQAELERIAAAALPVAVCVRFYSDVPGVEIDRPGILEAYRSALVEHRRRHGDATYFVFSDEPQSFADAGCLGVPFHVVGHGRRNEDKLYTLSRCAHFILSFSSYHWWGAWLSGDPRKQVFYLPLGRPTPPHYVPDGWTVVQPVA